MKKILKGYKLTHPEYKDVAYMIANQGLELISDRHKCSVEELFNLDCVDNDKTIERLEKAGVLNIWFEPTWEIKQFYLNDYVYVISGGFGSRGADGFVGRVVTKEYALNTKEYSGELERNASEIYVTNDLHSWGLSPGYEVRKATDAEKDEMLLDLAREMYPIGTYFKSVRNKKLYKVTKNNHKRSLYGVDIDGSPWLYLDHQWAEIVENVPVITKNGIALRFHNLGIEIGGTVIGHRVFMDAYDFIYKVNSRSLGTGIDSITIKGIDFTNYDIVHISNFYKMFENE